MSKLPRLVVALVLAPVIGCAVGTTLYGSAHAFFIAREQFDLISTILVAPTYGLFYGLTIGLAATLLLGLPAHIVLSHFEQRHAWGYLLAGVIIGLVTPFLLMSTFSLFSGSSYPTQRALDDAQRTLPLAALLGFCIAGVAWLIRRPDRDAANPATPAP